MLSDQSSCDVEAPACAVNAAELPMTGEGDSKQNIPPPGSGEPILDAEGESTFPDSSACDQETDQYRADAVDLQSAPESDFGSLEHVQKADTSHVSEESLVENSSVNYTSNDVSESVTRATDSWEDDGSSNPQVSTDQEPSNCQANGSINDKSRDAAFSVVEGCLQKVFSEAELNSELYKAAEASSSGTEAPAPDDQSDQGSVDMDVDPSPAEGTIVTTIYSGPSAEPSSGVDSKTHMVPSEQPADQVADAKLVGASGSTSSELRPSPDAKAPSPATSKPKGNEARSVTGRKRSPPRARSPFRRVRRSPFRGPRSPRGRRSPPRRRSPLRYRSLSPRRRDRALEPGDATCQIICLGTAQSRYTAYCMDQIHAVGISCSMRYLDQQSLSAVMGAVVHSHARYVIIIGKENELKGTVNFKVLSDKERKSVATTIENAITIMVDRERPVLDRDRLPRSPYPSEYHARDPRPMRQDDYDAYAPRYSEHDRYAPEPDRYAPEPDRYAPEPDRYPADRFAYERDPYAYPVSMPLASPAAPIYAGRSRDFSPPRESYSRYMAPLSAGNYSPPRDIGNLQHSRYQPVLPSSQSDGYSRYTPQAYGGYDIRSTPTPAASSSAYDPYAAVSPRLPPSRLGGTPASYAGPPPRSQYDQPYDYQY